MPIRLAASATLFDSDGVLVDSDAAVMRSWSRWAHRYGLDPAFVLGMVHGRRSRDTVAALIAAPQQRKALEVIDAYELEEAAGVVGISGAGDLLASLPEGAWAVVTSGRSALVRERLRAARIPPPQMLIAAEDVAFGKPHPDGYLAAAKALDVDPSEAVVFEDSPSGVEAALNARVGAVVGVGHRALTTAAEIVVPDLAAVAWLGGGYEISDARLRG